MPKPKITKIYCTECNAELTDCALVRNVQATISHRNMTVVIDLEVVCLNCVSQTFKVRWDDIKDELPF